MCQQQTQDKKWSTFISTSKKRNDKKMCKLSYSCTHFTCQQGYSQNPSSESSAVCEPGTSRYTSWFQKRKKNQKSNYQHSWSERKQRNSSKTCTSSLLNRRKLLTVDHNKVWKILKEMVIPDYLTCLQRNLQSRSNKQNWTWNN